MSGEPRTTDRMVDALLAAYEVPALDNNFANRVLAAALSSPTVPGVDSSWPRRSRRPWRRSPIWLGFFALNIIAASAVAAMVSGVPVWHHVTEIVQKVTHAWRHAPVHSARHRVPPRRLVTLRIPAASPATFDSTAIEPLLAAGHQLRTPEVIAPSHQSLPRPLALTDSSHHHDRMAVERRRERLMLRRPSTHLDLHLQRAAHGAFPIAKNRDSAVGRIRIERDRMGGLREPPAVIMPREQRSVATPPAIPYGPRLEPQRAVPDRQDRVGGPLQALPEARAERRRMHAFDNRPGRLRPHPRRGRFNF